MASGLELHEAAAIGDCDSLEEYLMVGKYDVNLKDVEWGNRTPLHWACTKGYVEVIRLLLNNGAVGNPRMDNGWTPAHCAAECGRIHVLRALHNANICVYKRDVYGDTPRDIAERYGQVECQKFLIIAEEEQRDKRRNAGKPEESDDEDDRPDSSKPREKRYLTSESTKNRLSESLKIKTLPDVALQVTSDLRIKNKDSNKAGTKSQKNKSKKGKG
ncbi:unnamed protein product [Owenia fusiformis]|uniref:Uncharacterized protein n=1 Tax=Owenia fusiformis TaxID=6347 RepID=A0A8J1TP17_OWEFU|nr:unnamed protein product [Owenia fusiformis]